MNNIPYKSIVGGLNITHDIYNSYLSNTDYFTESIIFGVKAKDNKTVIEADALSGVVNIPKLQYYVNAYTLTYNTNSTNNEINTNFINSYSTYIFPVIDPTYAYVSYHVDIMAYTLPTKHYVDKLLELKDALIYRGTLTPANSSGTNPGEFQPTGVENSESGSMKFSYTSAGSVYKVNSTGYFGNIKVHAGDMIISYSDSATTTSIANWNIIEMHATNTSSGKTFSNNHKLLSNIYLNPNGDLSYTYVKFGVDKNMLSSSDEDQNTSRSNRKYIYGIDFNEYQSADSSSILAVTYLEGTLKFNNISKQEDNINICYDSSYQFITNINQDIDGHLSYTYSIIKSHSHNTDNGVRNGISDIGEYNVNVLTGVHLDNSGKLTYTYTELKNPSLNTKNVIVSLFTGDNNVTYMLTTDGGNIKITQPIKRIYTTANLLPASTNTTITAPEKWVGTSYTIANPFGYDNVGNETITIEFNGDVPTGTTVSLNGYSNNTHFTYSTNGANLIITLLQGKVRTVSKSIPNNGTFGFANVTATTSVAACNFSATVNIGGNNINLSTSLNATSLSTTVVPQVKYYVILNGNTDVTSTTVNHSSKPSKLTTSGAGNNVRFVFPANWGTPTLKQLGAPDTAWTLIPNNQISTYQISTSSYTGENNKVNYKVYSHGAVAAKGTWDIVWQ